MSSAPSVAIEPARPKQPEAPQPAPRRLMTSFLVRSQLKQMERLKQVLREHGRG